MKIEMYKKIVNILLVTFVLTLASFASTGPIRQTVSNDGVTEIVNRKIGGSVIPGYIYNNSDFTQLQMPDNVSGHASAISGDGQIICGVVYDDDRFSLSYFCQASIWHKSAAFGQDFAFSYSELPSLEGHEYSSALDMSENAQYVIGYCRKQKYSNDIGCYWDLEGNIYELGPMAYDSYIADLTYPHSVSNDGVIVGTALADEASYQAAFIWDQSNGMRYLKDVLENDYGYDFSGCTLSQAYNISPDGKIVDGYGYNALGEYFDWSVAIPEPISILSFGIGVLLVRKQHFKSKV